MPNTLQSSLQLFTTQLLSDIFTILPRILAAIAVLLIGTALARALAGIAARILKAFKIDVALKNTPVEHFVKSAGFGSRVEEVLSSTVYWLVMLITAHTFVTVLGLASLSQLLERVLAYLPNIVAAIVILLFGVLLAGFLENVVKGAVRSFDQRSARLLGKVSSYLVMVVAVLAAVSELGIARDFILILFIGFVAMISLGFGLAIGLGGKELVGSLLSSWYKKMEKELK